MFDFVPRAFSCFPLHTTRTTLHSSDLRYTYINVLFIVIVVEYRFAAPSNQNKIIIYKWNYIVARYSSHTIHMHPICMKLEIRNVVTGIRRFLIYLAFGYFHAVLLNVGNIYYSYHLRRQLPTKHSVIAFPAQAAPSKTWNKCIRSSTRWWTYLIVELYR